MSASNTRYLPARPRHSLSNLRHPDTQQRGPEAELPRQRMTREQQQQRQQQRHEARPEKSTALLSQTVSHSPIVQHILPASLYGQDHRDAILVGQTYIQIKEFISNLHIPGHLEDVTTLSDLGGRVLSCKVLGLPSNVSLEMQDEHAYSEARGWPFHVLVLALDSHELLFLTGGLRLGFRSTFISARKPLPSNVSSLEQYGRHMAVDPLSRAMAVSAPQNFFGIMTMKPTSEIEAARAQGHLDMLREERYFRVDGTILAMDFLFPSARSQYLVILILLVCQGGDVLTHQSYTWDINYSLDMVSTASRELMFFSVDYRSPSLNPPLPIMMFPVTLPASYMIVTPLKAVLYRNIFSESPPIANELIPPNSKWTAWARPRRTEKWSMQHDDVYVCTDDGQLLFLSIDRSGHFTITSVDMVGTNFDTAFAILDVSAHAPSGDILLAAGSLGDGALFIAPARKSVKVIQRLANWAPSLDCLTLESSVPDLRWDGEAYRLMPGTRLLTCSGNGHDRGAVIELRHGIEAKIGLVIEREPVFVPNIYVMPEIANWGLYVLFAEPLYSTLLYIPRSGDEAQAVEGESLGFDLEARTLAAGFTPEGMLVQITERAVNLSLDEQHRTRKEVDPSSKILLAAIDGPTEGIATASKQGETYSVEMFAIITVDGSPALINTMARQLPAGDEPICLTIGKVSRLLCIFVGTADGRVVAIMPTEVPGRSATTGITLPDTEEMGGINSLLLLQSRIRNEEETILLCGLRNGWVVPFVIIPSFTTNPEFRNDMQQPSALAFKQLAPWNFGSTAASLSSASSNPASAVVACGPGLWHMQRVAQGGWPVLDVHPIWLTDQHTPAFTQPEVVTTTFISFPRDLNDAIYDSLNGSVALCTPNQFMICTLSPNSKPVPRTIFLPGSPQKMIYSRHLKALLVASIVNERVTDMKHVFSRSHPQIDLIDPDTSYPNPFSSKGDASSQLVPTAAPKPRGAAGERITAMMEWTFLFGTKPHTFIVIATQRPFLQRPEDRERGYLHFLPAKRNAQFPDGLDCTVKHRLAFDRPIRAMCPYKEHGFILCYGNVVRIIVLDQETRHFRPSPEFVLESEATSVSVRGAFVDVVTKRTSLLVLTESEDEPEKLTLFGQSGSDRAGLGHADLGGPNGIILSSHKGGAVVGYSRRRDRVNPDGITPTLFVAHLPVAPVHLVQGAADPHSTTYGIGMEGTVYRFRLLSKAEWQLLNFLQNLASGIPEERFQVTGAQPSSIPYGPGLTEKGNPHINGDVLAKLVDRGSEAVRAGLRSFGEFVSARENAAASQANGGASAPSDVEALFERMAEAVVTRRHGDMDMVQTVMTWLRDLVHV